MTGKQTDLVTVSRRQMYFLGFTGFAGFLGFRAFDSHEPYDLFLLCFFSYFVYFKYWHDSLKWLTLLGPLGLVVAILGLAGVIRV
jgi:hypothetical protein